MEYKNLMEKPIIFCDFDGTITKIDSLVRILDLFASPNWREIEVKVKSGEMGSRQSLVEEFNTFNGSWDDVKKCLDNDIEIDQYFARFLSFTKDMGIEFIVLSGGFTLFIDYIFKKYGIKDIPFYANIIHFSDNKAKLEFPHKTKGCDFCSHCKTLHLKEARGNGYRPIIYIGDGTTDRCPVKSADIVFAKDSLARYCVRENIPFIHWETFLDIQNKLEEMLISIK